MTGTASRTMPAGLLVVAWNAVTTLSRLRARVFFWPLPVAMISRSSSASASRSKASQALLDRRGAHAALEVEAEAVTHLAVEDLVALEVLDLEVLEPVPDLLEALDLLVGTLADLVHLALGGLADLAAGVGLGALGLELGEVGLEPLGAGVDVGVAPVLDTPSSRPRSAPRARAGRW